MTVVFAACLTNSSNFQSTFIEPFHTFGCNLKEYTHGNLEITMNLKRFQVEGVKTHTRFSTCQDVYGIGIDVPVLLLHTWNLQQTFGT